MIKKEIINKIILIVICIVLFSYGIIIGSPLKNNDSIFNLIVIGIGMVFEITRKKIGENNKIQIIDCMMILILFSSVIPLLFHTYANLQGTILYIIRYMAIFAMYRMIRHTITYQKEWSKYIINTILITGVIIFLFGIDNLTYEYFFSFLQKIGSVYITNRDQRFFSTFAYANTLAIYMLVVGILAIAQATISQSKMKTALYGTISFLALTSIILSLSRAVWLGTLVIIFLWICFAPKGNKKRMIETITINGISAISYSILFYQFLDQQDFLLIFISLAIIIGIQFFIFYKSQTIKTTYKVIIGIFLISTMIVSIAYGMQSKPLLLFDDIYKTKNTYTQEVQEIERGKNYTLIFDIESVSNTDVIDSYKIVVTQKDRNSNSIEKQEKSFQQLQGKLAFEIQTTNQTDKLVITYERLNPVAGNKLQINALTINGETMPVAYRYIPKQIVDKLNPMSHSSSSVSGRTDFMKEGCKLIQKNWLFGIGGDGWKYKEAEVQMTSNSSLEVHSYPIEIFLEFGILGIISFILLFVYTIYVTVKQRNQIKEDIQLTSIGFAFLAIIGHSIIDFDLSFMYMMVLFYTLLAVFISSMPEKIAKSK